MFRSTILRQTYQWSPMQSSGISVQEFILEFVGFVKKKLGFFLTKA